MFQTYFSFAGAERATFDEKTRYILDGWSR